MLLSIFDTLLQVVVVVQDLSKGREHSLLGSRDVSVRYLWIQTIHFRLRGVSMAEGVASQKVMRQRHSLLRILIPRVWVLTKSIHQGQVK